MAAGLAQMLAHFSFLQDSHQAGVLPPSLRKPRKDNKQVRRTSCARTDRTYRLRRNSRTNDCIPAAQSPKMSSGLFDAGRDLLVFCEISGQTSDIRSPCLFWFWHWAVANYWIPTL